jgi:hypothetical protein
VDKSLFLFFLFLSASFGAHAQLLSPQPLCVSVKNAADNEITGDIETASFKDASGNTSQHRQTFRLNKDETRQFCSTGPFFDNYQLRLVFKASMPLYSCKTNMGQVVTVTRATDENGFRTLVADCPSERQGR